MKTPFPSDVPTTELFVMSAVNRKACSVHGAKPGRPCWWVHLMSGRISAAICNTRALAAGYNAQIDPRSLQVGRQGVRKNNQSK